MNTPNFDEASQRQEYTVQARLTPEQDRFIEAEIAAGREVVPIMFVHGALWYMRRRGMTPEEHSAELRAVLQAGLQQAEQGEGIALTPESFRELKATLRSAAAERAARQLDEMPLPQKLYEFVQQEVSSGHAADASAVVRQAVTLLTEALEQAHVQPFWQSAQELLQSAEISLKAIDKRSDPIAIAIHYLQQELLDFKNVATSAFYFANVPAWKRNDPPDQYCAKRLSNLEQRFAYLGVLNAEFVRRAEFLRRSTASENVRFEASEFSHVVALQMIESDHRDTVTCHGTDANSSFVFRATPDGWHFARESKSEGATLQLLERAEDAFNLQGDYGPSPAVGLLNLPIRARDVLAWCLAQSEASGKREAEQHDAKQSDIDPVLEHPLALGQRLSLLRHGSHLEVQALASRADLAMCDLLDIENGRRQPSTHELQSLADAMSLKVSDFFGETGLSLERYALQSRLQRGYQDRPELLSSALQRVALCCTQIELVQLLRSQGCIPQWLRPLHLVDWVRSASELRDLVVPLLLVAHEKSAVSRGRWEELLKLLALRPEDPWSAVLDSVGQLNTLN